MSVLTKLRAGDRCPCCGQPITTSNPERLAILQHLADAMDYERTCGTCPVAVATAHDHLIVCPFAEACDGVGLRSPRSRCTMEVVE